MLVLIHISDLSSSLKYQVYGQPLVLKVVVSHLIVGSTYTSGIKHP
jgi:hypothetical protein